MGSLAQWICRFVVPNWVWRKFRFENVTTPAAGATGPAPAESALVLDDRSLEGSADDNPAAAPGSLEHVERIRINSHLFLFCDQLREREKRLASILVQATEVESDEAVLFGGCYLSGTGRDEKRDQAFMAGVFRRLIEEQNFVSWTSRALQADSSYQRWARFCYLLLVLLLVCGASLIAYLVLAAGWQPFGTATTT
jgi:hypothetical protein